MNITSSVHDFTVKNIDGKAVNLNQYKGKVLIIVNVASDCGYTGQYADLQAFYEEYKAKGVVVLGFPSNSFRQEMGNEATIKRFCQSKYNVTFPMFSKVNVKGAEQDPLYAYLTQKSKNGKLDAPVKWNFQKFIVDQNGEVVSSISTRTNIYDKAVIKTVNDLLK